MCDDQEEEGISYQGIFNIILSIVVAVLIVFLYCGYARIRQHDTQLSDKVEMSNYVQFSSDFQDCRKKVNERFRSLDQRFIAVDNQYDTVKQLFNDHRKVVERNGRETVLQVNQLEDAWAGSLKLIRTDLDSWQNSTSGLWPRVNGSEQALDRLKERVLWLERHKCHCK